MTTPTGQASAIATPVVRARDVLAFEWIKFRSVRSMYLTLVIASVTAIGLSALVAFAFSAAPAKAGGPRLDPVSPGFLSLEYAVLAVGVLGVLTFSSERSSGLIRTTFAAVPRRRVVLTAKAAVTGATTLVVGELGAFASFFLAQAILSRRNLGVSLAEPNVARAVLVEGTLLFVCAMIGLGLGAVIRHTAGAIAVLVGVFYLPALLNVLPPPWNNRIGRFTLLDAAQQASALRPSHDLFSPAISVLILLAWPAAVVLAAAVLITRRDE
jgi:ABC-2 type transport system permease protein